MSFTINKFQTLHEIVQGICYALAYPVPTDTTSSTDSSHARMVRAVNEAAREIVGMKKGTYLERDGSVSVEAAVSGDATVEVDLPEDFETDIRGTWYRDGSLDPVRPITRQQARDMIVLSGAGNVGVYFYIANRKLVFLYPPEPASPWTIKFTYVSGGHVIDADTVTLYKDEAAKNGDRFLIDRQLLLAAARLKYAGWIGADTQFFAVEYQNALERLEFDRPAPVLGIPGLAGEDCYYDEMLVEGRRLG